MFVKAFVSLSFLFFLCLIPFSPARADQTVILTIILNQENKGEYYIVMADEGDFFMKMGDLKTMGFLEPKGTVKEIDDEEYISLGSMKGVGFKLDEIELQLEINALPFHFPRQIIDFDPRRKGTILYPLDSSAFLNYDLSYNKDVTSSQFIELSNTLGYRRGNNLFLTDSVYISGDDKTQFVRLMTSVTQDKMENLERLVFGDFIVPAAEFRSTLNMGGFRFHKAYLIAPYLITHPLINLSGTARLPSDLELYMDGRLLYSEKLDPGEFDLLNIFPREGAGLMEVVIRDSMGREEHLLNPFYLTTSLLKEGFHDYDYNVGFLRKDFGNESFKYGDFAFSGFHAYGINDILTVGLTAERVKQQFTISPSSTFLPWRAGLLDFKLAASKAEPTLTEDGGKGFAGTLKHIYQTQKFNAQWALGTFSRNYSHVTGSPSPENPRFKTHIGFGYNTQYLGSFGMAREVMERYNGSDRVTLSARHSKTIFRHFRILSLVKTINDDENINEIFITLVYSPTRSTNISTSFSKKGDTTTETVQAQKNIPFGEGFGGRTTYEKSDASNGSTNTLDTYLQYNAPVGIYTGRHRLVGGENTYELSASGAVTYVGETVSFGRPVRDSFALLEVGDLPDIRVYVNNHEIGRTNASGKIFIPHLSSYYDNQISLNNQDVPIDYTFPDSKLFVSPKEKSGSYIFINVSKFRAIFGKIYIRMEDGLKLVPLYEFRMSVDGEEVIFQTSSSGEFYIEDIGPGSHATSFLYGGKPCTFNITIPDTDESLMDLGDLVCEKIK